MAAFQPLPGERSGLFSIITLSQQSQSHAHSGTSFCCALGPIDGGLLDKALFVARYCLSSASLLCFFVRQLAPRLWKVMQHV